MRRLHVLRSILPFLSHKAPNYVDTGVSMTFHFDRVHRTLKFPPFAGIIYLSLLLTPFSAFASTLNASAGGTFTLNLDHNAFAVLNGGTTTNPGDFLVKYYDTQASDYKTLSDSYFYLVPERKSINLITINML
jgi:hypothetical protein